MTAWIVVGVAGAATLGLKGLGPVLFGGRPISPVVLGVVALLTPTLLAALVVTQVFGGDRELVLDARAIGIGAAVLALLVRLPVLAVVVVAAGATALARAVA
jgi:Branched-chain amino acid transport protein (AzlD)